MKSKIIKILYSVASVILVGVVMFHISIPVVAGTTVESLPNSDVDISVVFDSDNLMLEYEGNTYSMPFHYDIRYRDENGNPYDMWLFAYKTDGTTKAYADKYWNIAKWTDYDAYGNYLPFSYWFSPSEYRVYVFSHKSELSVIESYSGSSFHFTGCTSTFTAINYWDLSDMSFHRIGQLGMSTGDIIDDVYHSYYLNSSYSVSGYVDSNFQWNSFSKDMLCIYSNYEISGFYEFDYGSVYTPEYYFDYRYLFFVEGVGYTFIDSARPLDYIEDKNNAYAYIYFKEECNSHVYTSVNGVVWNECTLVNSMYSISQQIGYEYFYDNVGGEYIATLVYTNDSDYESEPLITPEYGSLNDIINDLYNSDLPFDVDYNRPDIDIDGDTDDPWYHIANIADSIFGSMFDTDIVSWAGLQESFTLSDFVNLYELGSMTKTYMPVYDLDSGEYVYDILTEIGALNGIYRNTIDNNLLLDNIQINIHNDLKSVFDNISLTNTYMESIDAAITDLPDYTKHFNKSIGVEEEILDVLERIESSPGISLNPDSSGTSGTVTNFDMTVFNNWMSELDSSIDNISGLVAMDEMTDIFDSVVDESGETIGSLSTFLDGVNDEATISQLDDVGNYISAAMVSITKLKVLDAAFSYAGGLTNGIGFINAYADNFYAASGDYAPVFIVGTAMVCVNMFVRRRE